MGRLWGWFSVRSATSKVVVVAAILLVLALLSRILAFVAVLVFLVGLVAVVARLARRRPLGAWGKAAGASLVAFVVLMPVSNAIYGPAEQPAEEGSAPVQAASDEPTAPEEPGEPGDASPPREPEPTAESRPAPAEGPDPEPEAELAAPQEPAPPPERAARADRGAAATVSRVVDGDTIEISPAIDGVTDVRLIGVDTPETKEPGCAPQPYGAEASSYAEAALIGRQVELEFDAEKTDQ